MANNELIKSIKDPEVQKFLRGKLDELVTDVRALKKGLHVMPTDNKLFTETAGTAFYSTLISSLVPGISMEKINAAIQRAVWEVFCQKDDGHGVPKSEVKNALNEGEIGATLIEKAIVAAFVGITASLAGGFVGLIASGVAKYLGELVALWVAKILDKAVEDGFTSFCKTIPAEEAV